MSSENFFGDEYKMMLKGFFTDLVQPVIKEIENLKKKSAELVNKSEQLESRVVMLEQKLDEYEQNDKNNSVIIINKWKEDKNENVSEMILKFASDTLNCPLALDDIVKSHRIGKQTRDDAARVSSHTSSFMNHSHPRPILVEFRSTNVKNLFKKARTDMKRDDRVQGIFINDDLTKKRWILQYNTIQLTFSDTPKQN